MLIETASSLSLQPGDYGGDTSLISRQSSKESRHLARIIQFEQNRTMLLM
jgi:hypothetical protein